MSGRIVLSGSQAVVDELLARRHELLRREYARQCERFYWDNGRYPYYHYEQSNVLAAAKEAIRVTRIVLRR